MGLDNRGRWYRWDKKDTVGSYLKLDMARLKDVDFERSAFLSLTWITKNHFGERKSSLGFLVVPGQGLRLHYKHNGETVDPYTVPVAHTTPNFGGRRYWFLCPHCWRRVRILYGGRYFLCRHCRNLTYGVCQESHADALHTSINNRMWRIRRELGAEGTIHDLLPDKPQRMHWKTYEGLLGEYDELRYLQEMALLQGFAAISDYDPGEMFRDYPVNAEWKEHKRRRREDPNSFRGRYKWRIARAWANRLAEDESIQGKEPNRLTLGELAKRAGVPYGFAREAVDEGLLRPDQGRTTRRKRYRRRLAHWLAKLHTLHNAGMSWEEIIDWSARRWQPGHEAELRWPQSVPEK